MGLLRTSLSIRTALRIAASAIYTLGLAWEHHQSGRIVLWSPSGVVGWVGLRKKRYLSQGHYSQFNDMRMAEVSYLRPLLENDRNHRTIRNSGVLTAKIRLCQNWIVSISNAQTFWPCGIMILIPISRLSMLLLAQIRRLGGSASMVINGKQVCSIFAKGHRIVLGIDKKNDICSLRRRFDSDISEWFGQHQHSADQRGRMRWA